MGVGILLIAAFYLFPVFMKAGPTTQAGIQLPGQAPGAVSGDVFTLPFQTTVENALNGSRYGGTSATVDVLSCRSSAPPTPGQTVRITETNIALAQSCDLTKSYETITCSTSGSNYCTSAKSYKTGDVVLFHAVTTEKGGSYDNLYITQISNIWRISTSGGGYIWDIPSLKVYDRVDNDYVLFRMYSSTGTGLGCSTADGNTFCTNSTTLGTNANNFTLRTQSADFTIKVSINNIAGERGTCFGCRNYFLRNVAGVPQLTITRSVVVIAFNTNVGESGLLGQGWTKLSSGYPTANKTFYRVLEGLQADNSGSTTEFNIPVNIDLSTIGGETTTTVNIWIADMQIPTDVSQGAGTAAGSTAAAFGFSTRGLTTLEGSRYTTTNGNQLQASFTTTASILKGVA